MTVEQKPLVASVFTIPSHELVGARAKVETGYPYLAWTQECLWVWRVLRILHSGSAWPPGPLQLDTAWD